MTLEGLFWKVNQERKRIRNGSIGSLFLGAMFLFGGFSGLYSGVLRDYLWRSEIGLSAFLILASILSCCFGLINLRFSFKLSKRLKDSVSSAASDLLDHYKTEYKEALSSLLLIFAFIVFVIIDNLLTWGFNAFWFSFWVAMLCSTIVIWRYLKMKTRKDRKEIEKLIEEYLQESSSEAKISNATQRNAFCS